LFITFEKKVVENLIPGTDYFLVLGACTGGGCTNSSVLNVTTLETAPEVGDVVLSVFDRQATRLGIAWTRPARPNGPIRKYSLYMNEEKIYEGDFGNFLIFLKTHFFQILICSLVAVGQLQ